MDIMKIYADSGVPKNEFKINFGSKAKIEHEINAYVFPTNLVQSR